MNAQPSNRSLRALTRLAGAAAAMVGFLQLGVAAAVGVGVGQILDGTTRPMMTAVAVVSGLGLASFWGLVKKAPKLTAR